MEKTNALQEALKILEDAAYFFRNFSDGIPIEKFKVNEENFLFVDYRKRFYKTVFENNFDLVNPFFLFNEFSLKELEAEKCYLRMQSSAQLIIKLFFFDQNNVSENNKFVLKDNYISKNSYFIELDPNYRVASKYELMSLAKTYPDLQRAFTILAPESTIILDREKKEVLESYNRIKAGKCYDYFIPCLSGNIKERTLRFMTEHDIITKNHCVLGVMVP